MRECSSKGGEIAVMDVRRGRVLTTRALEVVSSAATSFKRRKMASNVDDDDQLVNLRHEANSPENYSVSPPATSEASDRATVSHCTSYESTDFGVDGLRSSNSNSKEYLKVEVQSHAECFETPEISTLIHCRLSREKALSPSSEHCLLHKEELGYSSTAMKLLAASPRRKYPTLAPAKMPSAAEIDDFFSAAENYEQKFFEEKYNYDLVKDVPLEGRYQWVRLKP